MLNKLFPSSSSGSGPVAVEPLYAADVRHLRRAWLTSREDVARHVQRNPHFCWWVRRTGEYVLGENWRQRSDVGSISDLNATGTARDALVRRLLDVFTAHDCRAVVLSYGGWEEHARFYTDLGFGPLERIVYYEQPNMQFSYESKTVARDVEIAPLQEGEMSLLVGVDHAAFPWLWWNSREEMLQYQQLDNVRIFLTRYNGQPMGYFSFTLFDTWGHLDRIAVDPRARRLGLGAAQLAFALTTMRDRYNTRRVTLSTQATNLQSRKLYEGFGFRYTGENYQIYGKMLKA